MLQISKHEYFSYFYFVIFVINVMLSLYAINLSVARLFVDSPFLVLTTLDFQ